MAIKYVKAEQGPGASVIYYEENGKKWIFEGGDRSWRNQNPGNMVVGKCSIRNGMIGRAGGFAIFPNYQIGHNALLDLLINEYGNFDLTQLMEKYAPSKHNNTKKYIKFIKKNTGVKENININAYDKEQFKKLWMSIEKMEGQKVGTIKEFSTKGQITKVKKDKKGKIVAYLIDGWGWIMKKEALSLAKFKKIDGVIVKRGNSIFLRSRPNSTLADNMDNKV